MELHAKLFRFLFEQVLKGFYQFPSSWSSLHSISIKYSKANIKVLILGLDLFISE